MDALIADLAGRHHGVLSRRELLHIGLTSSGIDRRAAAGRLHRVHRGVYSVGHARLTREGRWLAAVLTCGDAVLSDGDAALLWRVLRTQPLGPVHVTTASRAGRKHRPGIVVHRVGLPREDRTMKHGIPVTTPGRTLVDLAETLPPRRLERAVDEAHFLGLVSATSLRAAIERNRGRTGAYRLGRLLRRHEPGTTRTRSGPEERLLALCRRHGLPGPLFNAQVNGIEVDAYWPTHALIVEVDHFATHGSAAKFESDRRRDADLAAAGYTTRRVTDRQLRDDPEWVARCLRAALSAA